MGTMGFCPDSVKVKYQGHVVAIAFYSVKSTSQVLVTKDLFHMHSELIGKEKYLVFYNHSMQLLFFRKNRQENQCIKMYVSRFFFLLHSQLFLKVKEG